METRGSSPDWTTVRERFAARVAADGRSRAALSAEIGVSRPTFNKLLSGEVQEPWGDTLRKVLRWLDQGAGKDYVDSRVNDEGRERSEDAVLEFFRSEDNAAMERFLESILLHVSDASERKQVAVTVLSQVKISRLQAGRSISPELLELERRLLLE